MNGAVVGIDRFGESAPAGQLFELFGFTVDNVVKAVNSVACGITVCKFMPPRILGGLVIFNKTVGEKL
jgi:hypothetical protein